MVVLKGNSLSKRQQELNLIVYETVAKKVKFEEVKAEANASDINMLYAIDVASRYKNIEYLIGVLKGGDSLYISRAVKCTWLYSDEFSNVINTDYLHHTIFPFMSHKMKRKFLTAISIHLRNERAASFYTYCNNVKLCTTALKFLVFTSESFKLNVIKGASVSLNKIVKQDRVYISFLIGNSLILAKAFLEELNECQRTCALYKLRYLFSISNTEYLDLLEKYAEVGKINTRFGLRNSKQILAKYKERLLKTPLLYMNILNKATVTEYLPPDIAKKIAVKLLPLQVEKFWSECYCIAYDFILSIIPAPERFQFLTNIFNNKYTGEVFALSKQFLDSECYTLMTYDERETWALRHIESKKEIQGNGRAYLWYKFIRFDLAFPEIQKYVLKTKDLRTKAEIVSILIYSARNQQELEKLLNYYHDRHLNEAKYNTIESFITKIIRHHNIFYFGHDWWVAFNKILYSLDIYKIRSYRCNFITFAVLVYHIIHKMNIPNVLETFVVYELHWVNVRGDKLYSKVKEKDRQIVYEYFLQRYTERIGKVNYDSFGKEDENIPLICAKFVLTLLDIHKKSMNECPEIIKSYIKSNWGLFDEYDIKYFNLVKYIKNVAESDLLRNLKQDTRTVIDKIPNLQRALTDHRNGYFKLNQFLKKIKIYFPDVAKDYLLFFLKMIIEKDLSMRCVHTAVYAIFQLADDQFKQQFMMQYVPSNLKIDYTKIDTQTLNIQEGICRYACFSRPPVPLSDILMYIAGDYVQHCLPIFNTFLANLPMPLCIKFIESIINSPNSLQRHGVCLAFKSFSVQKLKKLINDVWNSTNNLSLRLIIYSSLYNKLVDEDETTQLELFKTLKLLTLDLHEDDLDEIYSVLISNKLPENLLCKYIEVGWQTVNKLICNGASVKRKKAVILNIQQNLHIVDAKFVKYIVEEHITDQLVKANIKNSEEISDLEHLNLAKWKLVATYIIYFGNDKDIVLKNVDLVKLIINKCMDMWNVVKNNTFIIRRFCWNFIDLLIENHRNNRSYEDAIPIYESVLLVLQKSLPLHVIYLKCWALHLTILNRKFIQICKLECGKETEKDKRRLILKETVMKSALEAGELIKKSIDKEVNYPTVTGIKDMILSNVNSFKCAIDINDDIKIYELYVAAAGGLIQNDIPEIYLLAMSILPINFLGNGDEVYESIVNNIRKCENEQVQFCLYELFVNADFKRRMLDF